MQSTDGNSEDELNEACAELLKIFSDPSRSPQKAYRTYLLTFTNGEPIFTLSEADRILEGVFEGIFDRGASSNNSLMDLITATSRAYGLQR